MTRLVFIDTETTSLRPDRRAWDIGLIVREPGQPDVEHQWFVPIWELDLGNADPFALRIGRFYERHPQMNGAEPNLFDDECDVLQEVEALTRGAHLVGAVPNFDAEVLATRMREHGIAPSWHYHLIDVEAMAVGWLAREATRPLPLPWNSDDLTSLLDLPPIPEGERHTALGDARWARSIYDRVTGAASDLTGPHRLNDDTPAAGGK